MRGSQTEINNTWKRVHYPLEYFDYGNNFNVLTNNPPGATSSVFTAPVNGVYQFNVSAYIDGEFGGDIRNAFGDIQRNRNGSIVKLLETSGYDTYSSVTIDAYDEAFFAGAITVKLIAGNQVYVDVYLQSIAGTIRNSVQNQLSGPLVFAD